MPSTTSPTSFSSLVLRVPFVVLLFGDVFLLVRLAVLLLVVFRLVLLEVLFFMGI